MQLLCQTLEGPVQAWKNDKTLDIHSKNRIVILTINLSCLLQMSEPIWCMDAVNCQDGMRMWRKVGWEWGKDCHVVLLHIVMNCVHSSESEITNCQLLWQFLFYSVYTCTFVAFLNIHSFTFIFPWGCNYLGVSIHWTGLLDWTDLFATKNHFMPCN